MRIALCVLASALLLGSADCGGAPAPRAPDAAATWVAGWKAQHAEAEADLAGWVRADRAAAGDLASFDREHPFRTQNLLRWAADHPEEPIAAFVAPRSGWTTFATMLQAHGPAMDAFIAWCRKHPEAARALASHTNGVSTATEQLYAGDVVVPMQR